MQDTHTVAVLGILADRDIDPIFPKYRCGNHLGRAVRVRVLRFLVFRRVAVVAPNFLEPLDVVAALRRSRIEAVNEPVARAENDLPFAIHLSVGGRRPVSVKKPRADSASFLAQVFASFFVEADERGRLGGRNVKVRPVLPVRGIRVKPIADDQHRAAGDVMRENAELLAHVVAPYDITIALPHLDRRFVHPGEIFCFVFELPVVAIFHPVHVSGEHFAAVRENVCALALDVRRRAEAEKLPVAHLAGAELRDCELPEVFARSLLESHQHRIVAFEFRIARRLVVCADEDFPAGDGRVAVCLRPELRHPFHVLRRRHVHLLRIRLFFRAQTNRAARSRTTPCCATGCRPTSDESAAPTRGGTIASSAAIEQRSRAVAPLIRGRRWCAHGFICSG